MIPLVLDSHPQICCEGEGLFWNTLAGPIDRLITERRGELDAKNKKLFGDRAGYRLPEQDDAEILLGTAILLALQRQCAGTPFRAVGEKTPENVFLFTRLKRLFPNAKLVGLMRDPRDVLTSAWHFFARSAPGSDEITAKINFINSAIPSLHQGAQTLIALVKDPASCQVVTYEAMHRATGTVAAQLFRFLGVSDDTAIVTDCVARTSFTALTGGRAQGVASDAAFLRKGVVGDWRTTFNAEMNALILDKLGGMFPTFGWTPP
jgi:hypothetical protein